MKLPPLSKKDPEIITEKKTIEEMKKDFYAWSARVGPQVCHVQGCENEGSRLVLRDDERLHLCEQCYQKLMSGSYGADIPWKLVLSVRQPLPHSDE